MSKFDEFFENTNIPLAIENYCHETWNAALDAAAKVARGQKGRIGSLTGTWYVPTAEDIAAAIERLKEFEAQDGAA